MRGPRRLRGSLAERARRSASGAVISVGWNAVTPVSSNASAGAAIPVGVGRA